jgi:chromosomal replication initiator protein
VRAVKGLAGAMLRGKKSTACPLVLHGPSGCGKTQLTRAFLTVLTTKAPELTARSEPAGDLARLASSGEDPGFADEDLQNCDLLILEDIQHLPERAADSVCELIDARARCRKALLVTTRLGPSDLTGLPRRLTSRLAAGLIVRLDPLGTDSRRILLQDAAEARRVRLTSEALSWLAEQGSGLRAALGMIQNLAQVAPQFPGPLNRTDVEAILAGSGQPTSRTVSVDAIISLVTATFGVTEKELLGPGRTRNVLLSRQVAMYLIRELAGLSLPRIGAAFGRDHTTVLHACRKIDEALESDAMLNSRVRQLRGVFA